MVIMWFQISKTVSASWVSSSFIYVSIVYIDFPISHRILEIIGFFFLSVYFNAAFAPAFARTGHKNAVSSIHSSIILSVLYLNSVVRVYWSLEPRYIR